MAAVREPIEISPGVLTGDQMQALFARGAITCNEFDAPDLDASALDLRLGKNVWEVGQGQRPATRELSKLKSNSVRVPLKSDDAGDYFDFDAKKIYLVELAQHLTLPGNISGRATGRSSIGRLDVITRLLTNESREYDVVSEAYSGPLHLLVLPQTFPIRVSPGYPLNQLRLFSGPPNRSIITRDLIRHFGTPFWYVAKQPGGTEYQDWGQILTSIEESTSADQTMFDLTVDLADPTCPFIFEAAPKNAQRIDLRMPSGSHEPSGFFRQAHIEKGASPSIVLEQGRFYIMKSKERLYIPNDAAVEVVAISERIGDIRIHYAGFAHPGFGRHENQAKRGTPLIFEVRATDMQTRLYDGSLLARIQIFRMCGVGTPGQSAYNEQELKLSSIFSEWKEPS